MIIDWNSLPKKIKVLARQYRDRALKPDYLFLQNVHIYYEYNNIDRDLKISINGLKQCIKLKNMKKDKMNVPCDKNQFRVEFRWNPSERNIVMEEMQKHFNKPFETSGMFLMPENGGFFGWHTNADRIFPRIYIVWVEKSNSSWFYLSKNGIDIITINEPKGWSVNCFKPPVWHAAKSNCRRFSMGFRQMEGKEVWLFEK